MREDKNGRRWGVGGGGDEDEGVSRQTESLIDYGEKELLNEYS